MREGLVVFLISIVCVAPVTPAVIVVEGGCTLPDAITAANTDAAVGSCVAGSGEDDVVLTDNVVLTSVDNGSNGLPKIVSNIRVDGNGFRISRDDAAPSFRIFEVSSAGELRLEGVTVSNGSCAGCSGGGIFVVGGTVQVVDSRISRNFGGSSGGGLASIGAVVVLENSTVAGNSSTFGGGGINQSYGTVNITGSTIARNSPNGVEVAFYSFQGTTIVNSTISGNTGGAIEMGVYSSGGLLAQSTVSGNGGFSQIYVYPGAMTVVDSVFAHGSGSLDCEGTLNGGGNFDEDGSCGGQPITGLDPVLRKSGGPTLTHALLPGSSAIDALAACPREADQRGFGRSASCDAGAFELGAFQFDMRSSACPGPARVRVASVEPGAAVEVFLGPTEGVSQVPGGVCDGTELAIIDPVLLGEVVANANGRGTGTFELTGGDCGQLFQGVEPTTCSRSVVRQTGCPGGKARCCAAGDRYEDMLDGTVLDCNTDLLWLRDASCDELPLTDAQGQASWQDAGAGAAALAQGICGLTDGSTEGDWRLATAAELCSSFTGQALSPCPSFNGPTSLIDSSVGPPTVVNRAGDGVWTEGDVFSGVLSRPYWSSTDFGAQATFGDLSDGDVDFQQKVSLFGVWPVRARP